MEHLIEAVEVDVQQQVLILRWCMVLDGRAFLWKKQPFRFYPMIVRVYCKPVVELDFPNLHMFDPSPNRTLLTAKANVSFLGLEFPLVRPPAFSPGFEHIDKFGSYYPLRFDLGRFRADKGSDCQRYMVKWLIKGKFEKALVVSLKVRFGYEKASDFCVIAESPLFNRMIPPSSAPREVARIVLVDSAKLDEVIALIGFLGGFVGSEQVFVDEGRVVDE